MSQTKPLKMLENRVWRIYRGGKMIDALRGSDGEDGCFPEDWLASVVPANNPARDGAPEREGLSRVLSEDGGEAYLKDIIDANPADCLGGAHVKALGVNFGVLTKFLDSAERLPIQVHPDKRAARELFQSDYGKTEAWYILGGREIDGEKPYILLGFKRDVTPEEWRALFDAQDIAGMAELMHKVPVEAGEVYIIEGGTPHAIGEGCFILEIQEPTDYTVSMEKCDLRGKRLPDFLCHMGIGFDKMFDCFHYGGRTLEELLDAFRLTPFPVDSGGTWSRECLIPYQRTSCFSLCRLRVDGSMTRSASGIPCALVVVEGEGTVGSHSVRAGDCLFIPAAAGDFTVEGELVVLECLPPKI